MPNNQQINAIFNKYLGEVYPSLMGEANAYSIYRPDYSVVDNDPTLIYSNVNVRLDMGAAKYAEPLFSNTSYFSIFTSRTLESGDLIVFGTYNTVRLDRPYVTFVHTGPEKETVGIRTSFKCHIANGKDQDTGAYNYVYQNVWYDTAQRENPAGRISPGSDLGSKVPQQELSLYTRANLKDTRLTVIDIDPSTGLETGIYYVVKQANTSGPVTTLIVDQNLGSY